MNTQNITDRKPTFKERFLLWFLPWLIAGIQRFFGLFTRRIDLGLENLEVLEKSGSSWIFAIWHANVLCSPYLNRNRNMAVMVSASKDGEYITRVVERMGNYAVRGSTSRGGVAALKTLVAHMKQGNSAAITPDGPRGPAFKLQAGIITLAQISGAPIIPFHYECTRQWILKSWDKHRVPKPFTTFVVSYGKPIYISQDLDAEEFEDKIPEVETALLANMRRCEEKVAELKGR